MSWATVGNGANLLQISANGKKFGDFRLTRVLSAVYRTQLAINRSQIRAIRTQIGVIVRLIVGIRVGISLVGIRIGARVIRIASLLICLAAILITTTTIMIKIERSSNSTWSGQCPDHRDPSADCSGLNSDRSSTLSGSIGSEYRSLLRELRSPRSQ